MKRDDWITTSEAGAILSCSRQHVVNLCNRGRLPFTLVGRHRRLKRSDVEAFVRHRANQEMTRDQVRSLWLHRAVAGRIAANPIPTLERALANARKRLAQNPSSGSERWLRRWLELLELGPEAVMLALTSTSHVSRELRQNSPFAGVLSESERMAILDSFQEANALR